MNHPINNVAAVHNRICEMYQSGADIEDIVAEIGYKRNSIIAILNSMGVREHVKYKQRPSTGDLERDYDISLCQKADREPHAIKVEYYGKEYTDITEFLTGV